MERRNNSFLNLIIFIFFTHGMLYFVSGDIYNDDNPVKLVKYILLIFVVLKCLFLFKILTFNHLLVLPFIVNNAITLCIYYVMNIESYSALMFFFPIFFFFIKDIVSLEKFLWILKSTMLIAFLFSLIELTLFQELSTRFSSTGFRSISIFVNPNNFGIFISLCFALIFGAKENNNKIVIVLFLISIISIVLSGSMTAAVIFVFIFLANILDLIIKSVISMKTKKNYIALMFFVVIMVVVINLINLDSITRKTDEVGLNNVAARIDYLSAFFSSVSNSIFYPQLSGHELYADNAIIYSWITIGFFGSFLYLVIVFLMISLSVFNSESRRFLSFFIAISLASMTTNVFNIWPIAYLFWAVVGYNMPSRHKVILAYEK